MAQRGNLKVISEDLVYKRYIPLALTSMPQVRS